MKKFSVLWVITLFVLPCLASADVDMNKIREVNEHCPKIDSGVVIIAREATKKCENKSVLKAVLFYHSDFGSRFYAAKKISDIGILQKAYKLAETAKISDEYQSKIRDRILQLINKKLGRKTAKKPENKDVKSFSIKTIVEMESVSELAEIFHKHPNFDARYYAVKRAYEVLSYIPHLSEYDLNHLNSKIEGLSKFKKIIAKSIPKIEAMPADSAKQKSYKKKLLAELHKMEKQINPKPGEEVYIDKQAFARHMNSFRKENGLEPIERYDSRLHSAALKWAKHHYDKRLKKLDHGLKVNKVSAHALRIEAEGYNYNECGENLARIIIPNAKSAFVDWRESPPHRENLLEPGYREMGLACVYAPLPADLGMADYVCVQLLADADH